MLMESGCGSAGSLSAGLLFRRDVVRKLQMITVMLVAGAWKVGLAGML